MKLLNIDVVQAYDWEGIYVLGKLWDEGHDIDWRSLARKHVIHVSSVKDCDEVWLAERDGFPFKYSEVVFKNPVKID